MTVAKKLISGFSAVILVILVLASAETYMGAQLTTELQSLYRQGIVATESLGQAATLLQRIRGRTFYHTASTDALEQRQIELTIEEYESEMFRKLDEAEATFPPGDPRRPKVATIRELYRIYERHREEDVYPASRSGTVSQALDLMFNHSGPAYNDVVQALGSLTAEHIEQSREVQAVASRTLRISNLATVVGSGVAALLAVAIAWLLARNISSRLADLSATAMAVSRGALDKRATVSGSDEIADLAAAFNDMTDALARKVEEQHELATMQEQQREKLATTMTHYGAFVERVARGDLRAVVTVTGDGELAELGNNLSVMGDALRTMTLRTHGAVGALTTASAEILATIQEHGTSASESASAVTQTVATVDQVAQSASQVAEEAKHVANASRQSVEVSSAGREAVDRTVGAMGEVQRHMGSIAERILTLSEQAQAVGQIITSVNELADQSNLLALNASIEAARAGEEGRGFAVVAQEIRAMADQSREATAHVRSILGDIQKSTNEAVLVTEQGSNAVKGAVDAVREAGTRIEQLATTIAHSAQAAQHILTAAQQQVQGMGQISQAMHSISEASSQIVEGTRQIESAARDLNQLSGQLRDAVAQYRT